MNDYNVQAIAFNRLPGIYTGQYSGLNPKTYITSQPIIHLSSCYNCG